MGKKNLLGIDLEKAKMAALRLRSFCLDGSSVIAAEALEMTVRFCMQQSILYSVQQRVCWHGISCLWYETEKKAPFLYKREVYPVWQE